MKKEIKTNNKIAFIISSLNAGGAERVVSLLANEFSKNKKVFVITLNKDEPFYKLDSNVSLIQLGVLNNSNNLILAFLSNFILIQKIYQIFKINKISHVIGFMTTSNILAIICGKLLTNIKVSISERRNPLTHNFGIWGKARSFLYKYADCLIVQTDFIKDYYSKIMPLSKIKIIKNPIILNKQSFTKKEKIVLCVGRLNNNKNQTQLIKYFSKIDFKDWKLVFCGDGPNKLKMQELIEKLNLKESVFLEGNVKNVQNYYKKASVFAFTSKSEGFPNAILEAMSFGCACISSNCVTGTNKLITNEYNGYLIEQDSHNQYVFALEKLMFNSDLRRKFVENSNNLIKEYSVSKITKEWEL